MSRRRGDTVIVAFVFAAVVAIAGLGWLRAHAAAQPELRRGVPRARARTLARGAWQRVEALLARGELTSEALAALAADSEGEQVTVEAPVLEATRLEVWIRVEVSAGPERLGSALRVRARTDEQGRWWVVDWHEVGR